MKLPALHAMRRQPRYKRAVEDNWEQESRVVPHQQGVAECQEECQQLYPDSPREQLACYKRECWN